MEIPLQISFKNMEGSEAIEARIREKRRSSNNISAG